MSINFVKPKNQEAILLYQSKDNHENEWKYLAPGVYSIYIIHRMMEENLHVFDPFKGPDNLTKFTSGIISDVIRDADNFFSPEVTNKYTEIGLNQTMGMLMYGPPGTGKTCTALLIMQELSKKYDAICMSMDRSDLKDALTLIKKVRAIQDNKIILFCDEWESEVNKYETAWLKFLDGSTSVKDLIFIGCTNYLDKIPDRFTKRRSRIKHLYEITTLPQEVYLDYIRSLLPTIKKEDLYKFGHYCSENQLVIDEVKHAFLDYYIDGKDMIQAIEDVKKYK